MSPVRGVTTRVSWKVKMLVAYAGEEMKKFLRCIVRHIWHETNACANGFARYIQEQEQIWASKSKTREDETSSNASEQINLSSLTHALGDDAKGEKGLEFLLFDFDVISAATEKFANKNMLGKGGFGPVYRGKLPEGQEIAVKRLSKASGQGLEEFKNEVLLISKLQHRNLVRLLGCCIYRKEKLLLYEFMPNKSLDAFIFEATKHGVLEWAKRYCIVEGIARGLLYLHRDSRLKIIHRDLKAANVLLDEQFNPKISDFGMARIFGEDQILHTTRKVVGTIGYMSPEYAMEGQYSEKSDVFSFGVLLLEVVSGKRNNCFYDEDDSLNLLGHTWRLWKENRAMELIDPLLGDSHSHIQVFKCIKMGLLCVQEYPDDRPTMASVVLMLSSDMDLPSPKQPAFYGRRCTSDIITVVERSESCSINDATITDLACR